MRPGRRQRPTGGGRTAGARRAGRPRRGGRRAPARPDRRAGRRDERAPQRVRRHRDAGPARSCSVRRPNAARPGGPLADLLVELALPPERRASSARRGRRRAGRGPRSAGRRRRDRLRCRDAGGGLAWGRRRGTQPRPGRRRRARRWPISIPTTRSSTGSACGRPGAPTGIACATACANCGSPRGRMRPAMASRSGWPPPGQPSDGSSRMDPGMGRPATGRPDRRDRRRLGRRAGAGRRTRPGRRPPPAGRRPVRPRPRPDPRAARVDPGCGRAAGDGRRPDRRHPRATRHGGHPGRPARGSECRLAGRPRDRRVDQARPDARAGSP